MWSLNDFHLRSILNMDNLFEGGIKTEYGLYAISELVQTNKNNYVNDAIDILDDLSKINFRKLNEKNNTQQQNEGIIIDVMYEVANEAIKHNPEKIDELHRIMSRTEENNERYVRKDGRSREEFMQKFFKIKEEEKKKELEDRIKANKKVILERRAEEQAAKDRFVENKDKKFYTFDDLEFYQCESMFRTAEAKMQFENGCGVSVRYNAAGGPKSDNYDIVIFDGNGKRSYKTQLTDDFIFVGDENGVTEVMKKVQKLDKDGKLPKELSEEENVVSGVVVADEIAEIKRKGFMSERILGIGESYEEAVEWAKKQYRGKDDIDRVVKNHGRWCALEDADIKPQGGKRLSKIIKQKYLRNKKDNIR